jgi:hypothetical protein
MAIRAVQVVPSGGRNRVDAAGEVAIDVRSFCWQVRPLLTTRSDTQSRQNATTALALTVGDSRLPTLGGREVRRACGSSRADRPILAPSAQWLGLALQGTTDTTRAATSGPDMLAFLTSATIWR